MAQQNKSEAQLRKGNPASKRMMNANDKAERKRCWERGQRRKARRIAAQKAREAFNKELRAAGIRLYGPEGRAARAERFG